MMLMTDDDTRSRSRVCTSCPLSHPPTCLSWLSLTLEYGGELDIQRRGLVLFQCKLESAQSV
jgi:hypothetical protein